MNFPEIISYGDEAMNTVANVINKAKDKLGERQSLRQLIETRRNLGKVCKISTGTLKNPLIVTSEKLIIEAIERKWRLTDTFMYVLNFLGGSRDRCTQYYYYEAIFSQPTVEYPIPQETASVFFRVGEKHIEDAEVAGMPMMYFRIEGCRTDHDIRYVTLQAEWLMCAIQMKLIIFKRIEEIRLF